MKRGQLAAVLIIVLLVAAVAGFMIFSQKRAGRATLMAVPPQYTYSGQQQQQAQQPSIDTTASGGALSKEQVLCGSFKTKIECGCAESRVISGKCKKMGDGDFSSLRRTTFSISADGSWSCSTNSDIVKFTIEFIGDTCAGTSEEKKRDDCISAARENEKCSTTTESWAIMTLDSMVGDCAKAAETACTSGFLRGKPAWVKSAGVLPSGSSPGSWKTYSDMI